MPIEQSAADSDVVSQLKLKLSKFETVEGRLKGLSYKPRADDVVITTTPKAGTTWVQQICHQLRSGGDMTFSEISEVVPWIELAADQGQDLNAPQYGDSEGLPRVFKSHCWEEHCPKFPKSIVVLRDPADVLLSFYRFFEGWFFEPDSISLDEFADDFWLARGVPTSKMQNASYFVHLISWYKRRDDPSVLIVFFEDMKDDLESQVRRIASFISTEKHDFQSEHTISKTVEHSTYEFMKANESYFDERLSKLSRNEACGLPKDAGVSKSKINDGRAGKGKKGISADLQEKIHQKWEALVRPVTDCSTYDELRMKMKA